MSGSTPPPRAAPPPSSPTPPTTTTHPLPLGFGAQIKALQETQSLLTHRITNLEHENAALKASLAAHLHHHPAHHAPPSPSPSPKHPSPHPSSILTLLSALKSRIEALESHTNHLTHRRREAVATLLSLRTLHQESANAFQVRAEDVQDDDLESMLGVWGTSIVTVLVGVQMALGQMRGAYRGGVMGMVGGAGTMAVGAVGGSMGEGGWVYPRGYAANGYCVAHRVAYRCRVCRG